MFDNKFSAGGEKKKTNAADINDLNSNAFTRQLMFRRLFIKFIQRWMGTKLEKSEPEKVHS